MYLDEKQTISISVPIWVCHNDPRDDGFVTSEYTTYALLSDDKGTIVEADGKYIGFTFAPEPDESNLSSYFEIPKDLKDLPRPTLNSCITKYKINGNSYDKQAILCFSYDKPQDR